MIELPRGGVNVGGSGGLGRGGGWKGGRSQRAEKQLLICLRSLLERRKRRRDLMSLATSWQTRIGSWVEKEKILELRLGPVVPNHGRDSESSNKFWNNMARRTDQAGGLDGDIVSKISEVEFREEGGPGLESKVTMEKVLMSFRFDQTERTKQVSVNATIEKELLCLESMVEEEPGKDRVAVNTSTEPDQIQPKRGLKGGVFGQEERSKGELTIRSDDPGDLVIQIAGRKSDRLSKTPNMLQRLR